MKNVPYGVNDVSINDKVSKTVKLGDGSTFITAKYWDGLCGLHFIRSNKNIDIIPSLTPLSPTDEGWVDVSGLEDESVYLVFDTPESIDTVIRALQEIKRKKFLETSPPVFQKNPLPVFFAQGGTNEERLFQIQKHLFAELTEEQVIERSRFLRAVIQPDGSFYTNEVLHWYPKILIDESFYIDRRNDSWVLFDKQHCVSVPDFVQWVRVKRWAAGITGKTTFNCIVSADDE